MNEGEKNPLNLADQKHFVVFHSYLKYVWLRSESIVRHCNDAMLMLLEKSPKNLRSPHYQCFSFLGAHFANQGQQGAKANAREADQTEV